MDTVPGTPASTEEADAAMDAAISQAVQEEPAEDTPTGAAEPAPEPEQPRDALGRFASPSEAEPEASSEEPAPPEAPAEPTAPVEAEAETEELPDEPFVYRADGQDFDIPGSAVGEDGVFIPADHVPEVQQLLSAGKAAFGSVRQRLTEAAQREQQALDKAASAEAQAQHLLAHFESLIEKSQGQPLDQSPIGQWLLGVSQNWPILKAQAEAKAIELKNQAATKELERYREQEQQARIQPIIEQTLRQSVWNQGQELGLDERTLQAVFERLRQPHQRDLLIVKAPYDDPGGAYRKGESVMNHSIVRGALELAAINRPTQVQQQKIAQAQAQNAAQAQPKAKIPPTVGGKGRAPAASTGIPQFQTTKQADEWFANGGYNELEVEE